MWNNDMGYSWIGPERATLTCYRSRSMMEGFATMLGRTWPAILVLALTASSLAVDTPVGGPHVPTLEQRERRLSKTFTRASQFADVPHISSRPVCENVRPPEELATPDPYLSAAAFGRKVKVSFIIGTDGRVHSPLILESAGIAGDRRVLQTVRTWRYRPATCNGVPTETEGKIEFSSR
jgi:TonB family protein